MENNAIPLYYQIETTLKRKILRQEIEPGTVLPPENKLAEEFGVSRITIRQALGLLQKEGFIERKRGKGTFVSPNPLGLEPAHFTGFMEDVFSIGFKTTTRILNFAKSRVLKKVTDHLELPKDTEVYRLEKLRLLKGEPFSYVQNYVPVEIGEQLKKEELSQRPLMKILEDDLHIDLAEAIQTLMADSADSYIAPFLEIPVGEPVLNIERTVFDTSHRPVEFLSICYRADRYRYTARLVKEKVKSFPNWELSELNRKG